MADSMEKRKKKLNIMNIEAALFSMELKLSEFYLEIERKKEQIAKQTESLKNEKEEYKQMD